MINIGRGFRDSAVNEFHHLRHAQTNGLIVVIHLVAVSESVTIAVAIAIAIGFYRSHRRHCNHAVHGHQLAHGERYIRKLHPFLPQIANSQNCFRVTTKQHESGLKWCLRAQDITPLTQQHVSQFGGYPETNNKDGFFFHERDDEERTSLCRSSSNSRNSGHQTRVRKHDLLSLRHERMPHALCLLF